MGIQTSASALGLRHMGHLLKPRELYWHLVMLFICMGNLFFFYGILKFLLSLIYVFIQTETVW